MNKPTNNQSMSRLAMFFWTLRELKALRLRGIRVSRPWKAAWLAARNAERFDPNPYRYMAALAMQGRSVGIVFGAEPGVDVHQVLKESGFPDEVAEQIAPNARNVRPAATGRL